MLHRFFLVLYQRFGTYLSSSFLSFFLCGRPGSQSPLFGRLSFLFIVVIDYHKVLPELGDLFVSQNPIELCISHSPGRILGCAYSTCPYSQTWFFRTTPSGLPSSAGRVYSYILFALIHCIRLSYDSSMISSLWSHNLHLLFCCVLSSFFYCFNIAVLCCY